MKLSLSLVPNISDYRWIAIENDNREILQIGISNERNMFVAERFILNLVKRYGEHPVSTDGRTWYPQACRFLNIQHHDYSSIEKSFIERTIQYIKDRTECFDDYFPCMKDNDCKLQHVMNWLSLFVDIHNREIMEKVVKLTELVGLRKTEILKIVHMDYRNRLHF